MMIEPIEPIAEFVIEMKNKNVLDIYAATEDSLEWIETNFHKYCTHISKEKSYIRLWVSPLYKTSDVIKRLNTYFEEINHVEKY